MKVAVRAFLLLSSAIVLLASHPREQYEFVSIDVPGGYCSMAWSISNDQTAGLQYAHDADCQTLDTVFWQRGQFVPLPPSAYPNSIVAMATVNYHRAIFGDLGDVNVQHAAFIDRHTGALTLLPDIPGKPINMGQNISISGRTVGMACEGTWFSNTNCLSWTWDGRRYTFLKLNTGLSVAAQGALGINDSGQVVWLVTDTDNNQHTYITNQHTYMTFGANQFSLDVPGAASTAAFGINNLGSVALNAYFDDSAPKYMWNRGHFTPIPDVPAEWNSVFSYIFGLNDQGDYCGQWWDADGNGHAFIALHNERRDAKAGAAF